MSSKTARSRLSPISSLRLRTRSRAQRSFVGGQKEIADTHTHVYVSTDDAGFITGFAATREAELLHFGTSIDTWGTGLAQELHDSLLQAYTRTAPPEVTRI